MGKEAVFILADVVKSFDEWLAKDLAGLNSELLKKELESIVPLTREAWETSER